MTSIEWTDAVWNPVVGCSRVSAGCEHCYAERVAHRAMQPAHAGLTVASAKGPRWTGDVRCLPERLDQPLRWRKPRRVFVNSMSDLFHEKVPDEFIDAVFAVMDVASHHTFQVLTKRPERMRAYCADEQTPFRVARQIDALRAAQQRGTEEYRPIAGYPGYVASSHGFIYSEKRGGRRRMKPDASQQGHQRVQLHRDGGGRRGDRLLVHRLILEAFVGPAPTPDTQGRHGDGDPTNNALSNLSWGDQPQNWSDARRHGNFRRYAKLSSEQAGEIRKRHADGETGEALAREFEVSSTQIRNIASGKQWAVVSPIKWPLRQCWLGVSVEDQATADARIPLLLQTPAALRFVSYEPAIGRVNFDRKWLGQGSYCPECGDWMGGVDEDGCCAACGRDAMWYGLDWLIVGGESGPGARPCDVEWIRSVVQQCRAASVPCFVKQLGSLPMGVPPGKRAPGEPAGMRWRFLLRNGKGGDPAEWPADLRVREFPEAKL